MSTRALLLVAAATLALAGCSAGKPAAQAATKTAATTTAPTDPYDTYTAKDAAAGITPAMQRDEAVSVAGNTCDNTVTDMAGLIGGMQQLYTGTELQNALTDRANFIDTYCPNARIVYDAATQQVIGQVIPAAH